MDELENTLAEKEQEIATLMALLKQEQQAHSRSSALQPLALDVLLDSDEKGNNQQSVGLSLTEPSPKPIVSKSGKVENSESQDEKFVLVSPMSEGSLVSKPSSDGIKSQDTATVSSSGSGAAGPVPKTSSNSNFMLVNEVSMLCYLLVQPSYWVYSQQLQQQLIELKKDLAKRGIELEGVNQQLLSEKEEKVIATYVQSLS